MLKSTHFHIIMAQWEFLLFLHVYFQAQYSWVLLSKTLSYGNIYLQKHILNQQWIFYDCNCISEYPECQE